MNPQALRQVVIVGGGTAGWMAAAGLARVFGPMLDITLVESEEIGTVGVGEATIPQIQIYNRLLGLDEDEFIRATQGTFKLGIVFDGWGAAGERYIHAFGEPGAPLGGVPFHHHWLRDRLSRTTRGAPDLWAYSLNAQAAWSGRFARTPPGGFGPLGEMPYAFHFDAHLYAKFLRAFAERLGVRRVEGKVVDVTLGEPDGRVQSIRLDCGVDIEGELFVDCSGFRGLLIEQALKTGYEDWSEFLPADRAVAVPCALVEEPTPWTKATADTAGWRWRIPLQHRTGNGYVFCSRFISEDEAISRLLSQLDGEALAEPRPLRFVTGKRKRIWNRNVVALGLASGFMEPLESTSIHLVQACLDKLIQYFPDERFSDASRDRFNAEADAEYIAIRDFLVLHYTCTRRDDSPFWRHCRTGIPRSETLKARLDLWRETGRLTQEEHDLFKPTSWLQVLVGQGLDAEGFSPLAGKTDPQKLASWLSDIRSFVAQTNDRLPTHAAFLAANAPAGAG
jgi:tryptophan halogenase